MRLVSSATVILRLASSSVVVSVVTASHLVGIEVLVVLLATVQLIAEQTRAGDIVAVLHSHVILVCEQVIRSRTACVSLVSAVPAEVINLVLLSAVVVILVLHSSSSSVSLALAALVELASVETMSRTRLLGFLFLVLELGNQAVAILTALRAALVRNVSLVDERQVLELVDVVA